MADENEMNSGAGDPGETMNIGSGDVAGASAEPKQNKEEWNTVVSPKIQRPTPASQPPVAPPPQPADVERTILEGAGSSTSAPSTPPPVAAPVSQPTPGISAGYSTTPPVIESVPSSGGMAWMEGLGIKDPGTQKIVLFGGGGAVLLCCLCSCIGLVATFLMQG